MQQALPIVVMLQTFTQLVPNQANRIASAQLGIARNTGVGQENGQT